MINFYTYTCFTLSAPFIEMAADLTVFGGGLKLKERLLCVFVLQKKWVNKKTIYKYKYD